MLFDGLRVMQLVLKNNVGKAATLAIGVIVFALLFVWIARAYLATLVSERPTAKNLQAASQLDPSDAEYPLELGRLYQYSAQDIDPDRAIQELTRSAQLNPYDPQTWLDLANAFQLQGEADKAEACMRRADFLAPHLPRFQWAIGNFFLLHNNLDEAFRHFKMVLAANEYQDPIFNTAWKASGDPQKILAELIPKNADQELQYLNYLIASHHWNETEPVWELIAKSPDKFPASMASPYIDILIGTQKADEAYQVWTTLRQKGIIPATYESTPQNLVENGDFESQPMGIGFDWRIAQVGGIYVGMDDSAFHSPAHSLLIQFPGTQNFDYHNIYQYVPVKPNRAYHLSAFMRTEGITTDSGPRMEVRDAYKPNLLDKYSDQLTGSSPTWIPLTINFKTSPQTHMVIVTIARVPSEHFDNQIAGRVWVDDVSLAPESGETDSE